MGAITFKGIWYKEKGNEGKRDRWDERGNLVTK